MKKNYLHKNFIILFIAVLIFSSKVVMAQPTAGSAEETEQQMFFDFAMKEIPDPAEDQDAVKANTENAWVRNQLVSAAKQSSKESQEENRDLDAIMKNTTRKEWKANYYSIFESHLDTMYSDSVKDFMNEQGKGIVSLFKYAQLQTEPSIATGSALASDLVFNIQKQALESDKAFRAQLEANPEFKHVALATYNACLSKQIKDGKKWVAAISFCQQDTIGEQEENAGTLEAEGEAGLKAEFHPDKPESSKIAETAAAGLKLDLKGSSYANSVSVVDSLVNQAVANQSLDQAAAQKFAKNFIAWFGDMLVEYKEDGTGTIINEVQIKPARTRQQIVQGIADLRFDQLMTMMSTGCEVTTNTGGTEVEVDVKHWIEGMDKDQLRKISIQEVPFQARLGDALLATVAKITPTGEDKCAPFFFNHKNIPKNSAYMDIYNNMYSYAYLIASAQFLSSIEQSIGLTSKLISSANGEYNPLRGKAFSLIEDVAGSVNRSEIIKARRNIIIGLSGLVEALYKDMENRSGSDSARMSASMRNARKNNE